MSLFLRILGITNAAVWFGSALFMVVAVRPAFSSAAMQSLLPASHAGAAAQVVLERYFVVQYCCGAVGLVHLFLESLYSGQPWRRTRVALATGALGLALFCGLGVEPRVKRLHLDLYGRRSTPQQQALAKRPLGTWQATLEALNAVLAVALWMHLWEIYRTETATKLIGTGKFRG